MCFATPWVDREWGETYKYGKGDTVTRIKREVYNPLGFSVIDLDSWDYKTVGRVQECYGSSGYSDDRERSYLVLWNNGRYGTYSESSLEEWIQPPVEVDRGAVVMTFDKNRQATATGACSYFNEALLGL